MLSEAWGSATEPNKHNASQFRYLVHGVSRRTNGLSQNQGNNHQSTETKILESDESFGDQSIDLYEEPERVAERISLSMSLIDQDHTGTWTYGGLILDVPEKNIIGNGPSDLGSANWDKSLLQSQFDRSALLNPDDLLKKSSRLDYNEVIALANLDGSKIRLKGFFIVVDSSGLPIDSELSDKIQEHAKRLKLPLVNINRKGFSFDGYEGHHTNKPIQPDDYDYRW